MRAYVFAVCLVMVGAADLVSGQEKSPESAAAECVPMWHGKLGHNWALAGIREDSKPIFKFIVKSLGINNTYTPGRRYNIVVLVTNPNRKKAKRFHGFHIVVIGGECGSGTFKSGRRPSATKAKVAPGCTDLVFDGSTDMKRTRKMKWKAPTCGCVTMVARIRSSENILYEDAFDGNEEARYQVLTKKMCMERV